MKDRVRNKYHILFCKKCRNLLFDNSNLWDEGYYKGLYANSKFAQFMPKFHFLTKGIKGDGVHALKGFDIKFVSEEHGLTSGEAITSYLKTGIFYGWHTQKPKSFELDPATEQFLAKPVKGSKSHALALHLFHYDLWDEMAARMEQVADLVDIYITVTENNSVEATDVMVNTIKERFPEAQVLTFPNHGRDILPFMQLVKSGVFSDYLTVAKIHTKKSNPKVKWRERLIGAILHDRDQYLKALESIDSENAGIVGSLLDMYSGETFWKHNLEATKELCSYCKVPDELIDSMPAFLGGSIFVIQGVILDEMRNSPISQMDWPVEAGQLDGTKGHQIERLFSVLCRARSKEVVGLLAPSFKERS